MVSRKYLCSAPNFFEWDEYALALLKSLGGDEKRGESLIKNTLAVLGETLEDKKKSGPGRKSNAEHALNFYQYMLDSIKEGKYNDIKSNNGSDNERSEKKRNKRSDKNESESGDEVEASSGSVVSMNSQEFFDQHNDLCEVCNVGGDLLCCSTCNLVFHLKCTRPHLKAMPPDNWSCSYCVSTGITGYKRDARIRRRACSAVRLMNRMRKELLRGGKLDSENEGSFCGSNDDNPDDSDDEHKDSDGAHIEEKSGESTQASSNSQSEFPKKDRNLKRKREEVVSSDASEDMKERRLRRARKQPTLYDPQDCPASEWQSDGVFEWKTLSASEAGVPDDEDDDESNDDDEIHEFKQVKISNEKGDESVEKMAEKTIWCNFCKDDPSIPICCFCACRVCFGKHDGSKLLICDQCDDEYHTYCLVPPLDNVPLTQKWYCRTCQASKEKHKNAVMITRNKSDSSSAKSVLPITTSFRSSPRKTSSSSAEKSKGPNVPVSSDRRTSTGDSSTSSIRTGRMVPSEKKRANDEVVASKIRGKIPVSARGRGSRSVAERVSSPGKQHHSDVKVKRPRGRPPAKKSVGASVSAADNKVGEKRGPGRPRKHPLPSIAKDSASSSSPRRGRQTKGTKTTADGSKGKRSSQRDIRRCSAGDREDDGDDEDSLINEKVKTPNNEASLSSVQGVQRSRSGRMVKRSAFHDEMYDDGQPLRSARFQGVVKVDNVVEASTVTKNAKVAETAGKVLGTAPHGKSAKVEKAVKVVLPSTLREGTKTGKKTMISTGTNLPLPKPTNHTPRDGKDDNTKVASVIRSQSPPWGTSSSTALKPGPKEVKPLVVDDKVQGVSAAIPPSSPPFSTTAETHVVKTPRRKPGARECMQISRRFGVQIIPEKYMDTLLVSEILDHFLPYHVP